MLNSRTPDIGTFPQVAGEASPRPVRKAASPAPSSSLLTTRPVWPWLPLALLALAAVALAADCSLAQWLTHRTYPSHVAELIELSEVFGHGLGVLILVLIVRQLDVDRRRMMPRLLCCAWGAGMAANGIKMFIARTRPHSFDLGEGVLATFTRWFPLGSGGAPSQSFPSAHTATAVGFAVALAWLYPRGRWVFVTLAVMVACQRLQSGAHYLSDVLVGAAVGLAVARACLGSGWLARQFDRLEMRLKMRSDRRHHPGDTACLPAETPQLPDAPADTASRNAA